MVKLLVSVLVLVLLAIALDAGARLVAENRIATELKSELNLSSEPSASIHGWPFTAELVSGKFDSVMLSAPNLEAQDLKFTDAKLKVNDVRFSMQKLLSGSEKSVREGGGSGTAVLTAGSINTWLIAHQIPIRVKLSSNAASISSPGVGSVNVDVSINGSSLSFGSVPGLGPIGVPLTRLGVDIQYASARVQSSKVVVSLKLAPGRLHV